MNSRLYSKLAMTNLWNNRQIYVPYLLASTGSIAMYYIIHSLSKNIGIDQMRGSDAIKMILSLGAGVIAIFSFVFLLYTNGFLMKRRKKEIGLLNILGMEKKHIGKMMILEVVIVGMSTIILGMLFGIVFSKLVFMILYRLLGFTIPLIFTIPFESIQSTFVLFLMIQAGALIINLFHLKINKPIDLLKGTNMGEKEPRIKWFSFVSGIIALISGYVIAIVIKSPLSAISMFFIAAILVMYGTYTIFAAGSIYVLNKMKKNQRFYYQPDHFINISGMIYRMKQNAVGLANICILSCAVLVMLSTTVSLYLGMEDAMHKQYPREMTLTATIKDQTELDKILEIINQNLYTYNLQKSNQFEYQSKILTMSLKGNQLEAAEFNGVFNDKLHTLVLMTQETYNRIESVSVDLKEDECLLFSKNRLKDQDIIKVNDITFINLAMNKTFSLYELEDTFIMETEVLVVKDLDSIIYLYNTSNDNEFDGMNYNLGFDVEGDKEAKEAFLDTCVNELNHIEDMNINADNREANRAGMLSIIGGLLFIGIFLGILFLMATALIIYYKQVMEGYDDRERYVIMQKVGMSHSEVHQSINSQIRMVFLLPLITAFIHIMVAFKMMTRLLLIFSFKNDILFLVCTLGTMVLFAAIYGSVYKYTAKTYYKIVSYL